MCGIVGYVGGRPALPILTAGLECLEYRGYDSAGVALLGADGRVEVTKQEGKLAGLLALLAAAPPSGELGIGHTRWATHGAATTTNAHPHVDCHDRIVVVHNGIIENHARLRAELVARGHTFRSATDTEVLAHLIEEAYAECAAKANGSPPARVFAEAVRAALARVEGAYALAAFSGDVPGALVAARHFSPLVVGLGQGESFLASDIAALLAETRRMVLVEDGEVALLTAGEVRVTDLAGRAVTRAPIEVTWDAATARKDGYEHFVRKEIDEQPRVLADTLRGRLAGERIALPELEGLPLAGLERVVLVAAGSSYYAGLVGKLLLERWARLPVEVAIASELRYGDPVLGAGSLVVLISQSGETADTLAAMRRARAAGAPTVAITNVVGSSVTRGVDATLYLQVGPEVGVVATKTFAGQLALLVLLAAELGRRRGVIDDAEVAGITTDLRAVPEQVALALQEEDRLAALARRWADRRSAFFIGRGFGYPIALEGALKLKEISYIHAEGYPAGELKHGPIALLEPAVPVVAIATASPTYDKVISNIEEVRARGAEVTAVATAGDATIGAVADHVVFVPAVREELSPLVTVVTVQLLAYHAAVARGCDVDQPRNLAKSVTVE
jgi:glucosamine--fructose-6-phosphate aminotransferase (isomerizing)